uniref:DDE-1 domain-containing protein n=1 Tax=Spongospora subterranea TaxID=70186 RepID=A0A0H5QXP7_9EUKA|eukprot:CRZ06720.1 hypothetical protein [Spongospora subterranea]
MTGKFGGNLFHEWKAYRQSVLTFNSTHLMTQLTGVMFLKIVVELLPLKTIGFVWDRSHTHFNEVIDSWVENYNLQHPSGRIIIAFVEAGMTSVMQLCDLCVNKPLKQRIRNAFYEYREER